MTAHKTVWWIAGAVLTLLSACSEPELSLATLYDNGYEHLSRGDLQAAQKIAQQGHSNASTTERAAWQRAFRVLEAEVLAGRGQDQDALALLETDVAKPPPVDAVQARALMTRGLIRCRQARYDDRGFEQAEALLHQASDVATTLAAADLQGEIDLRRGTCEFIRERFPAAEKFFEQALATARRNHILPLETQASGSLGLLRIRTGRFDEATEWLARSLETAEKIGAHSARAKTLSNLGWCYFELGDYERAQPILRQAEILSEQLGLDRDRLVVLNNLGRTLFGLGDPAQATAVYTRALDLAEKLGDRQATARLYTNIAGADRTNGRLDEAEANLQAGLALKIDLGDHEGVQHSRLLMGMILATRGLNSEAEELCRQVIDSPFTVPDLLWEAHGALAKLLAKAGKPEEAEAELETSLRLMNASGSRLQKVSHRMSFFSGLKSFYEDAVEFWVDTGRPEQALQVVMESRGRALRERLLLARMQNNQTSWRELQKLSRETNTILLSFWVGSDRSFLWVIHPGGLELKALPTEADLRRDIEAYQATILQSGDPLAENIPQASKLWRTLIAPVADLIPRGSRVIVALDGPLHLLNLETLIVPGPRPHFWIEDVTLAFTPTLSYIRNDADRADSPIEPRSRQILLIGDPLPPNDNFPRLAHAGLEIRRIAELFAADKRAIYAGVHADPSAYPRAQPDRFDFIHLAAHVTANRQIPLESAVILSPRDEAYKLYARDVIGVPLRADLVTLSACRSAGSRSFAGEGLVGLAWAFMNAGARHVIGGLWDVEDASTSELMQELYRGLQRDLDPAQALRQAKLRLLSSETAYRKPFYWAPFVAFRGPTAALAKSEITTVE